MGPVFRQQKSPPKRAIELFGNSELFICYQDAEAPKSLQHMQGRLENKESKLLSLSRLTFVCKVENRSSHYAEHNQGQNHCCNPYIHFKYLSSR